MVINYGVVSAASLRGRAWCAGEAEQLRAAGIEDVRLQHFDQQQGSSLWLPERWELRLLANAAFGTDSADVVLETAMALAPSEIPGGQLTAPIVYVGRGSPAELMAHRCARQDRATTGNAPGPSGFRAQQGGCQRSGFDTTGGSGGH